MSRNDAWMPLHIGDYLSHTMHLSTEEHGAYLLLRMAHHHRGELPLDNSQLRRLARCSSSHWVRISATVLSLFVERDDGLHPIVDYKRWADNQRRVLDVSPGEWRALRSVVFARDGFACNYCGAIDDMECDHVIPVARGGLSVLANLVAACKKCNRSKGASLLEEWSAT